MPTMETAPYQSDRLGEALAEYEMAREEGRPIDRRAFLAAYADLADELVPLLDAAEGIDKLAGPVREALGGRPPLSVAVPDGYEILEEIGRGGMGVVYRAKQKGTEQLVALKLLRPDWLAGLDDESRAHAVEQFRVEARAAARLRHANRVRILHLGECEGRPFYAMELIEGRSLAELMKQPPGVSKESAVRYLASVAEAVQEAHDRGILHRDIKPHNILIDGRTDEALLADFGLAMFGGGTAGVEAGEESVRYQARVAGTLPYMSPEQTEDSAKVTARSDIYGLGATLYEVLTGTPPFAGRARAVLIARIRGEDPIPPSHHRAEVNRRLEGICLRCLEKDPRKRYATAAELGEELRAFMEDVRYTRNFTRHGTRMLLQIPFWVLLPVTIFWMLQGPFWEPAVWALMFSGYLMLFAMLVLISREMGRHRSQRRAREFWAIWVGHMMAAVMIAAAMRVTFPEDPRRVLLMMYPVVVALNGMANLIEASKMSWKLLWGPVGYWVVGAVMVFHLEWGPLYYCAYHTMGLAAYGCYLRKLGRELG